MTNLEFVAKERELRAFTFMRHDIKNRTEQAKAALAHFWELEPLFKKLLYESTKKDD